VQRLRGRSLSPKFRVALGMCHQHADAPHRLSLLRARRERPGRRCSAECGQQFALLVFPAILICCLSETPRGHEFRSDPFYWTSDANSVFKHTNHLQLIGLKRNCRLGCCYSRAARNSHTGRRPHLFVRCGPGSAKPGQPRGGPLMPPGAAASSFSFRPRSAIRGRTA
jgi:hypothetical protein